MGDNLSEDERASCGSHSWTNVEVRKNFYCDIRVGEWTSWTKKILARRFLGCTNYLDRYKHCHYRCWIDPELTSYYKEVICDLKEKEKKLQNFDRSLHRTERGDLKQMELKKDLESMKLLKLQIEYEKEKLDKKHRKLKMKASEMQITVDKGKRREQVLFVVIVVLLVLIVAMFVSMGVTTPMKKHMLPN